jgi:hypothetical protein
MIERSGVGRKQQYSSTQDELDRERLTDAARLIGTGVVQKHIGFPARSILRVHSGKTDAVRVVRCKGSKLAK